MSRSSRTHFSSPADVKEAFNRRRASLRRYERWKAARADTHDIAAALAGVGWLYELLPEESRRRRPDPRGVMALHRRLAVLARKPA